MKKIIFIVLMTFVVSLTACHHDTRSTKSLAEDCENYYVTILLKSGELLEEEYSISIDKSDNSVTVYSHDLSGKVVNTYTIKDDLAEDILACADKHNDSLHQYSYSISEENGIITGTHITNP